MMLMNTLALVHGSPLNNSLILQHLKGEEQKNAIKTLLNQGFHEYYFAMNNFEDTESTKLTEELLKSSRANQSKNNNYSPSTFRG